MVRTIKIPKHARPVADVATGRVALETARLDARLPETMLALALAKPGDALVLSRSIERVKAAAEKWIEGTAFRRVSGGGFSGYKFTTRTVWIGDLQSKIKRAPFGHVRNVFVADADRFPEDPVARLRSLRPDLVVCGGMICDRGHWWHDWARDDGVRRFGVKGAAIVKTWKDQDPIAKSIARGRRDRDMNLSEVQPAQDTFRKFARERVRIITDKGAQFLTPAQRTQANRSLGEGWDESGATPVVPFEPSGTQKRYLAIKRFARALGFRKFLLLKYRRGGFTTLEQALSYHLVSLFPRSKVATIAHTAPSTQAIYRMVDEMHRLDTQALDNLTDSRTKLWLENGSEFRIGTAGSVGFGRGEAFRKVHGSEVSRWGKGPNGPARVEDLVAGINEAVGKSGETVFETTPNGLEWFANTYKEWKGRVPTLIASGSRAARAGAWFPVFLRWFDDPINRAADGTYSVEEVLDTMNERERELVETYKLDAGQIAFRRSRVDGLRHLFPQEYPEDDSTCFLTTGNTFFDPGAIIRWINLLDRRPKPVEIHVPGGHIVIAEQPVEGAEYVQGADTSEGNIGGDFGFVGVLRRDPVRQVAWAHGHFKPEQLGKIILELGTRYNRALTSVEREGFGYPVIEYLTKNGYGKSHMKGGPLFWHSENRAGWTTTYDTRAELLNALDALLSNEALDWVMHRRMLDEMLTFRKQSSGRWDHDARCHDDTLFGWGQAAKMLTVPRRRVGVIGVV